MCLLDFLVISILKHYVVYEYAMEEGYIREKK